MNYELGRVGIVVRDAYDPAMTYEQMDLVTYNGGAYIAKGTTRGNLPTSTQHWVKLAENGLSAYESAKLGGYTGTQSEFYADIASLRNLAGALAAIMGV